MSSNYMSKENESTSKLALSLPTSPTKDTYARRTASLNAEAALKCLTDASRRMSPSTRAYFSRKRNSQGDTEMVKEINLPDVVKLTPTSACNDSSAVRSLQFGTQDSVPSSTRVQQKNIKSKEQCNTKTFITKTITVPQDLFVRRTANLNASACMTALLNPTKKAKIEESSNGHNYAVIVPAQEDVEVDVVDVDPVDNKVVEILKTKNDKNKVEPNVTEVVTVKNVPRLKAGTVERPLSTEKVSESPPVSSPAVSKTSLAVPDKTLVVPLRDEKVRELVEEGVDLVEKTTQRKPSKLSRRVRILIFTYNYRWKLITF